MNKQSSRYDQDFGAFDDDYRGFDANSEGGARGPLILALAIGVLLIFGAVIWNTYSQGIRSGDGTLPVIVADVSPYKRVPDEPGGLDAPDQNRRIYDQMDGSQRDDASFEAGGVQDDFDVAQILQGGPPIELRPGQEADIDEVTGIPKSVIPQVEALENLDNVPDEATTGIASEALPAANPPDPVLPVQEPPVSPVRFATDGAFLVQIAALRSQEAADAAWTNAVADTPRLFDGAEKRIQRADLGAKGVFYRLRVGAFSTRDDAKLFCDTLKSGGRACIVVAG